MGAKGKTSYLLYPSVSIRRREAYNFYRASLKTKRGPLVTNYERWLKIVNACWKETSEGILQKDGGVFLAGLGYFGVWMNPIRQKEFMLHHKKGFVKVFNEHTDHHTYHPTLFTELDRGRQLMYWTMDRAFNQTFTRKLADLLRKGKKFTLRYSIIKGLFKNINNAY